MNAAKSDKEWQAEMDANTLAEAGAIKEDSKRLQAAKKIAKERAEQALKVANEEKAVARTRQPLTNKQRQRISEGRKKSIAASKRKLKLSRPKPVNPLLKGL